MSWLGMTTWRGMIARNVNDDDKFQPPKLRIMPETWWGRIRYYKYGCGSVFRCEDGRNQGELWQAGNVMVKNKQI